jgi:hypothetical protein
MDSPPRVHVETNKEPRARLETPSKFIYGESVIVQTVEFQHICIGSWYKVSEASFVFTSHRIPDFQTL